MTYSSEIANQLALLAEDQSNEKMLLLCEQLEGLSETPSPEAVSGFLREIQQPAFRDILSKVLSLTLPAIATLSPRAIALGIRSIVAVRNRGSDYGEVELVWTGPSRPLVALRRTDQVLTDLIREAKRSLMIVSFVVYKVPHIAAAIAEAIDRGVSISLILESEEDSSGKLSINGFDQLNSVNLKSVALFTWPIENRGKTKDGLAGSLHAKCAIADRSSALISSANLTEFALNLNMELGALVKGGDVPMQISDHFQYLIDNGILVRRS